MFIDNILGTSSKIKILRTLSETNTAFNIMELQKETGLSRGIIHREVTRLTKEGILQTMATGGKERAYNINMENRYSQKISDIFSLEKLQERKNKVILKIWNVLESVVDQINVRKLEVAYLILFGSHVRGMATPKSDIDILIVSGKYPDLIKDTMTQLFAKYEKKLRIKTHPVFMSLKHYIQEQTSNTSFSEEVNKGSIILYQNVENYEEYKTQTDKIRRGLHKGLRDGL